MSAGRNKSTRRGFTLVELMISFAIIATIMTFMTVALQREAKGLQELQTLTFQERLVQDLMTKIEQRLDFGQGVTTTAALTSSLSAGEVFVIDVDDIAGFPDRGTLLIDAGQANVERIGYTTIDPGANAFLNLTRGARCSDAATHGNGATVLWAGTAIALEEQTAPPPGSFDGITREIRADVFFRGDGSGFSYKVPVDPTGGTEFMTSLGVRWGADVSGTPTEGAGACLYFEPVAVITELARNTDLNQDGDRDDTFDLGRIRQRAWNGANPALGTSDHPLCPPLILQEQCNWGGDLDADGFADPMFFWTPEAGRLRLRLFALVGDIKTHRVVKRFETVFYLRNGAAD